MNKSQQRRVVGNIPAEKVTHGPVIEKLRGERMELRCRGTTLGWALLVATARTLA